ncbi:tRNA1(Val) (adenine(37)-N6)-methyltransferase [Capillibacterium thermochitinicola]|uniref:tRNA1(Val) (Adenine(37)-N6)-methyltransferase n=1 Tax=Capillibacterium thermochitinicola TaxID=2699427 RepID=A0A8J6I3W6_9FIRM|nr:tRNA1(Val) (adenine(37)-N6)-methyltransferase [Capillibacterium thermochitinicola]MBA2133762.1 tRNA1(Val) (adenine(37)-N6)-methyltransferase [Capillibacterium thermochitinicola]
MSEERCSRAATDRLGLGDLRIKQHPSIFKFTVDPILLAGFVRIRPGASVLDLGTGAGVIPLWLTGYRGVERVTGLEIQPEVAALARENVKLNGLEDRIRILTGDLRTPPADLAAASFDWVLSNPPYWPATAHLLPETPALAQAKFELTCTLRDVVAAAAYFCRNGGRVGLIHLPERLPDLLCALRDFKLEPKRLCLVQPKPGARPHRVLVEAQKLARPGLKVMAPFSIQGADGNFSPEMVQVYQGKQLGAGSG